MKKESVRKQVLAAAQRLCEARDGWTFAPEEVVRSLPGVNETTVRTEITGRCCVNAPKHAHRWPYFRRLDRGRYQIEPAFRQVPPTPVPAPPRHVRLKLAATSKVAENAPAVGEDQVGQRDAVHAVVTTSDGWYVAECLEIAVVTQAKSFDALLENLREAVALYMNGEDPARIGLAPAPRLFVSFETAPVGV